jgi:hypothetical protein
MKKLRLNLDALEVQTFRTTPGSDATRGTVRANSGCCYSGDDCTGYWSTCDGGGGTAFCPGTGMQSCGCSNQPETCAAPCYVSEMTDCHRC